MGTVPLPSPQGNSWVPAFQASFYSSAIMGFGLFAVHIVCQPVFSPYRQSWKSFQGSTYASHLESLPNAFLLRVLPFVRAELYSTVWVCLPPPLCWVVASNAGMNTPICISLLCKRGAMFKGTAKWPTKEAISVPTNWMCKNLFLHIFTTLHIINIQKFPPI